MTFDKITNDGRLWAVRYGDESDNELYKLFEQWNDVVWLRAFFKQNWSDLLAYYNILDVKTAIIDTIEDSNRLENILLSISKTNGNNAGTRPYGKRTR